MRLYKHEGRSPARSGRWMHEEDREKEKKKKKQIMEKANNASELFSLPALSEEIQTKQLKDHYTFLN